MWLPLLSNVTKAPEPGPDTETVAGAAVLAVARRVAVARGVAALVALLVPLARLGTAPLRTVVHQPVPDVRDLVKRFLGFIARNAQDWCVGQHGAQPILVEVHRARVRNDK